MRWVDEVYLLKNLRGIVYFSPSQDASRELDWLKRKFKYRILGISKSLADESRLRVWSGLRVLSPKIEISGLDKCAADSLALAAEYICPLLVLKQHSLSPLSGLIIHEIRTSEELDDRELKRNIRLVNYSILDFCRDVVGAGEEERKEIVERDARRFWRVKQNGKTLIAWVDLAKVCGEERYRLVIPCMVIEK